MLTPTQARDQAREILADAVKGIDPIAAKRSNKTHTFKTFLEDEYQAWVETHRKRGNETIIRIKTKFSDVLDKPLSDISPLLIEKWRVERFKKGIKASETSRL